MLCYFSSFLLVTTFWSMQCGRWFKATQRCKHQRQRQQGPTWRLASTEVKTNFLKISVLLEYWGYKLHYNHRHHLYYHQPHYFSLSVLRNNCDVLRYSWHTVVQSLSPVWFFATLWTAACQASLSFTVSWSLLKLMSIELVMPSHHLTLCHHLPSSSWHISLYNFKVYSIVIWYMYILWHDHHTYI